MVDIIRKPLPQMLVIREIEIQSKLEIMVRNILFTLTWAIIACSCQSSKTETTQATQTLADSLRLELNTFHKKGFINGFGTAIVNEKGVLFAEGIGLADTESNSRYTENTIQNIGSVSKTFIGVALLKAQELGKLDLDDPIMDYLPFEVKNPSFPDLSITIRQLATHTSTILDTDYYDEKSYILKDDVEVSDSLKSISENFNSPDANMPLIDFLEKLLSEDGEWYEASGFLNKEPGEIYEYSNVGATLAAAILEIATGNSFNEFATEHILRPLEMTASGWSFEDIDLASHSTLYANPETELPYYSLITYPDGGLITSISDLGKYLSELIKGYSGQGTLLTRESYAELFREQLGPENLPDRDGEDDYDDEYNTGIFMGFTPRGYVGHTGGDPGIATFMFFNPSTQTGRVMMINTSVRNSGGVEQFYSIWYRLGEYEKMLNQ